MSSGSRCACGCGQKTAETVRQRKLTCDACGCALRMARSWLERIGAPGCACGGAFVPDCLDDRLRLPGPAGDAARDELGAAMVRDLERRKERRVIVSQPRCHGCQKFLTHPRELCHGCGFQNDPRPGAGGYVETTYSGGFGSAIPF